MRRLAATALAAFVLLLAPPPDAVRAQRPEPRTIVALVDVSAGDTLKYSRVHQLATMPLNHIGLVVEQHDIAKGLPDLTGRTDVRGILTWFSSSERKGAYAYLDWAERQIAEGRRFVVLGEVGALADRDRGAVPLDRVNRFLEHLGVSFEGSYVPFPVGMEYLRADPRYWGFEDRPEVPAPFAVFHLARRDAISHLRIGRPDDPDRSSDLVVTSPTGGFASEGFVAEIDFGNTIRRWLINPFRFFSQAFDTDDLPKPDTTTLVGRRIFYSHVDGDGWRNQSEVKIGDRKASAAEVLYDRIATRFADLPMTVAPIAAELDPQWVDDPTAREAARRLFELPNVEPGSHTYTHPFQWSFFRDYDADRERRIVQSLGFSDRAPDPARTAGEGVSAPQAGGTAFNTRYEIPRAFYLKPFDLHAEVNGSLQRIQEIAGGRKVELMQWSGDTSPFEAAVRTVREAGIPNMNGGDTRFDADYPSYGFVAPIGIKVGAERQIYASNSNENTYTDLWSGRYFGFRHLQETLIRTEIPIRIKPLNVYYHSYSAERVASLNAVIENLEFARRQPIVPIRASRFARMAGGFYTAGLVDLGERRWRVEDRGALQTVRFDRATLLSVDLARSTGVLGFRHLQGSLYVALDPADPGPVVALGEATAIDRPEPGPRPYLLESRWTVEGLSAGERRIAATVAGFGNGEMTWIVPRPGRWRITLDGMPVGFATAGLDNRLQLTLPAGDGEARALTLSAVDG